MTAADRWVVGAALALVASLYVWSWGGPLGSNAGGSNAPGGSDAAGVVAEVVVAGHAVETCRRSIKHSSTDPRAGIVIGVLVAIMVFGVALDLRWEHFRRILKDPRAPIVGLFAQFVVLPAIALAISHLLVRTPSVALGLLLVASVPGGAVSNYMTYWPGAMSQRRSRSRLGKRKRRPAPGAFWPRARVPAKGDCRVGELNRLGGVAAWHQALWSRSK